MPYYGDRCLRRCVAITTHLTSVPQVGATVRLVVQHRADDARQMRQWSPPLHVSFGAFQGKSR